MNKYLLLGILGIGFAVSSSAQDQTINPSSIRKADETPTGAKYNLSVMTLYYGLSSEDKTAPETVAVVPLDVPYSFSNATPNRVGVSYEWVYSDAEGNEMTSTDKNLSVKYGLQKMEEGSSFFYNWYDFPTLTAGSPSTSTDSYKASGKLQAGGGSYCDGVTYGLTNLNPQIEGQQYFTVDGIPVFGYNDRVDEYWSRYTFQEEYGKLDPDLNYNHLIEYGNFFYPMTDGSLVVNGVRTTAIGKVSPDAVFTASIYRLPASMVIGDEPDFTATCTGDDIVVSPSLGQDGYDFISLNFTFDEPVVITKKTFPYYLVVISGFNDPENVEYFNPQISAVSSPTKLGLGWLGNEISWENIGKVISWSPVANSTNDELYSFYIMLDAAYPWLEIENEVVSIAAGGETALAINSYYDASELTIEGLPDWLTVSGSGRFEDATLIFSAAEAVSGQQAVITLSAPGVSADINVSMGTSGIGCLENIAVETDRTVYSLDGRRLSPDRLSPGIYIIGGKKVIIN